MKIADNLIKRMLNILFITTGVISSIDITVASESVFNLSLDYLNTLQQEDQIAKAIIRRADRIRAPDQPFRYTLTLTEHKEGRDWTESQQVLDIYMRFYKPTEKIKTGDARAIIRFVSPVRDKGKIILADIENMWFYTPDLRKPIPVSRQQRLTGQIANGDVIAADLDYSYISTLAGEESCGEYQCYKLLLTRRWDWVSYPQIIYWVEKQRGGPYRLDFMSTEGLVIKRSWYQNYKKILGELRPVTIRVEDALRKDVYTTMEYSDIKLETLPEWQFQKEYLSGMN